MKNVKVFYNEKSGNNDEDKVLKTIKDFLQDQKIQPLNLNLSIQKAQRMQSVLLKSQSRPNGSCGCFRWRWNHQ